MAASLIKALHKCAVLRRVCRKVLSGVTVRQSFHGGIICLDAVEHSWAWTGDIRYETFDSSLQSKLLELSRDCHVFFDVGCNVGAMTLSVILHNPVIHAVSVDPNRRATYLLAQSLAANGVSSRARIVEGALAPTDDSLHFDTNGSVTGHIWDESGVVANCVSFSSLIQEHATLAQKILVKVDIEGFESRIIESLLSGAWLQRMTLVIELHAEGFNGYGDPSYVLSKLVESRAVITSLDGLRISEIDIRSITQLVARWPDE